MSGYIEKTCVLVHRCHEQLLKLGRIKNPDDEFNDIGIPMQQGIILKLLLAEDGLTQKELTKKLQITSSSCGALIIKMEKCGYLERRVSTDDKRTFNVYLMESGRVLGNRYKEMSIVVLEKLAPDMTENDKEQLFVLLTKLYEGIENILNNKI